MTVFLQRNAVLRANSDRHHGSVVFGGWRNFRGEAKELPPHSDLAVTSRGGAVSAAGRDRYNIRKVVGRACLAAFVVAPTLNTTVGAKGHKMTVPAGD